MRDFLNTIGWIMALSAGFTGVAAAMDYSRLSNEEMVQMRSQVREMAPEERNDYRTEMQSRTRSMSSEERNLFRQMNGQGNSNGNMNRYGQSGNSSGNRYRYGQGSGNGSGNMHRYGQDGNQSSGSNYGSRRGSGYGGGRRSR